MMKKHLNREQLTASYDWYRHMRETQPVFFDPKMQAWNIFRYDDVARVLSDHTAFSSDESHYLPEEYRNMSPISSSILRMDPPRHRQLRQIVSQAFTPRMVTQMESRIQVITNTLLDQVQALGEMDVIKDLAAPLPVTVIAELLGIHPERREDFKRWSDIFVEDTTAENFHLFLQAQESMVSYFNEIMEERRVHPQDDLVSALLTAEVDGKHLSNEDVVGFCVLLLVAGNETTTNLIGNAILCLDEHPEVMERLHANRDLVSSVLEETLRYYSPVKLMVRGTLSETTLGDQRIEADQLLFAWIASANRDEVQFPDANQFTIERKVNRHISFGRGIHFCLGAPLARLEAKVVLNTMLDRLPGSWHIPDVPLSPIESMAVFGIKALPLTWEK